MIYLDEAATTPIKRDVLAAMAPYLGPEFANASSQHEPGHRARQALEQAREQVAAVLGVRPREITFTSGGTESNNTAIKGIALADPRGRHVIVSAVEHPSILESAAWLERFGYDVTQLGVDREGRVAAEALAAALRPSTTVVSIQYANNEVGTVQDVAALAAVAVEAGVPFHTDAVQAASWLNLDVDSLGVQAMSISGHKLGAPKGVGVLYVAASVPLEPLVHGGGQEGGLRSGTQNVAGAVGMAKALELAGDQDVSVLRDAFIARVEAVGGSLTGHRVQRLPGSASFVFPGRSGESVLLDLERRGIVCSSGSACAAGSDEPSHVLTAMGYDREVAQAAVRFTFGSAVTVADLDAAADALAAIVA